MLQKSPAAELAKPAEAYVPPAGEPDIATVLKVNARPVRLRRYVIAAVVILAIVAAAWFAFGGGSAGTAISYATADVTRGGLTVSVGATGTVQPTNTVEISSELSGTVATVDVDFNDTVTAGETLATLKTDKLAAAVELAEATLTARQADVRQAEATVAETAATVARTGTLAGKGLASQSSDEAAIAARDRALANLDVANANLDVAAAELSMAQSDLENARIISPIDGVVLSREVEVGQIVAASTSAPVLFTLAEDLTQMELQVDIDEADVGRVEDGDSASFRVESFSAREFPAAVEQVRLSSEEVEGVVSYKAILAVDNADLALRPGMTATAAIVVDKVEDALLVPNAAFRYAPPAVAAGATGSRRSGLLGLLLPSGPGQQQPAPANVAAADGSRTVWVLRDGVPAAVSVLTGVTDGTRTAIVSGDIVEGDKVITALRSVPE